MQSEHAHQVTLINWFDAAYPKLSERLFAIPNGGHRHVATAKKMKSEGVRAGVPDCMLPVAKGGYHGIFIELKKTKTGRVSKEQKAWNEFLNEQGYLAVICYGFDEAKKAIEEYLAL